jgi:hypothetical protein
VLQPEGHGFEFLLGERIFFNIPNPSSRTLAMWSPQPLTEMSTRNHPSGKMWSVRKSDNLIAICEPIIYKLREHRRLTTLSASTACYRDSKIKAIPVKSGGGL